YAYPGPISYVRNFASFRVFSGSCLMNLPWIILLAPLVSAGAITFFTRKFRGLSSFISVAAAVVSLACSWLVFLQPNTPAPEQTWIDIPGAFHVSLGLSLDSLSKTMLLIVT